MVGEEFGADGYEISYHSNPRPSHADMGGRQYAKGEARTVKGVYYPSFEKEAEPLLNEYGCLHFKFSILLGISRPVYSNEQLEQMKAEDKQTFEFEGKEYTRYEASQLQRKIETAVRHEKDLANMAKASGDDDLRREAQYKINLLTSKYAQLSKASGLPTKMERMQVGGFRRVKEKSPLTKAVNGGIIKSKENILPSSAKTSKEILREKTLVSPQSKKQGSELFAEEKHKALLQHEQILNGNRYETAVIYDEAGEVLFKKKGNADSVTFTKNELLRMKGKIVTHNHPNNSVLSTADIDILRKTKAAEMRASTTFGTYVINYPSKWSSEISSYEKIDKAYNKYLDEAYSKALDKAARNGKPAFYYFQEAEENGLSKFCQQYGLKFRKETY